MALTVIGVFENEELAENAQLYLLANGFNDAASVPVEHHESDNGLVNIALRNGCILTLYTETVVEAQEGYDVLNNHGAIKVDIV